MARDWENYLYSRYLSMLADENESGQLDRAGEIAIQGNMAAVSAFVGWSRLVQLGRDCDLRQTRYTGTASSRCVASTSRQG
jgi:ubiquinone biosynthesis protein UbiJ